MWYDILMLCAALACVGSYRLGLADGLALRPRRSARAAQTPRPGPAEPGAQTAPQTPANRPGAQTAPQTPAMRPGAQTAPQPPAKSPGAPDPCAAARERQSARLAALLANIDQYDGTPRGQREVA